MAGTCLCRKHPMVLWDVLRGPHREQAGFLSERRTGPLLGSMYAKRDSWLVVPVIGEAADPVS
jgi:hypothetical protein